MSIFERKPLILKQMKATGIDLVVGEPNKKYDSQQDYELIHISDCFVELIGNNE